MSSTFGAYHVATQQTSYQLGSNDDTNLQNPLANVPYIEQGFSPIHMQQQFYVAEPGISHMSASWMGNQVQHPVDLHTAQQADFYNYGTRRVDTLDVSSTELSVRGRSLAIENLEAAAQEPAYWISGRPAIALDAPCMAEQSNAIVPGLSSVEDSILSSPEMQRIFLNFITCTGPTLSLYERPPFDQNRDYGAKCLWNRELLQDTAPFCTANSYRYSSCGGTEEPRSAACYACHKWSSDGKVRRWTSYDLSETISPLYSTIGKRDELSCCYKIHSHASSKSSPRLFRGLVIQT